MKTSTLRAILTLFFILGLLPRVGPGATLIKNPDKPQKGNWNCKPQKAWSTQSINDDLLVDTRRMETDADGNLYVAEFKHKKMYILNPDGKLITSFGKQGEGPGEFKFLYFIYIVDDWLIAPDAGKIHYFSLKGKFIKDVTPGRFVNAKLFIDKNRLVETLSNPLQKKGETNWITLFNPETKEKQKLVKMEFEEELLRYSKDGTRLVLKMPRATADTVFATDFKSLYYGYSAQYTIHKIDFTGKPLLSFSVEGRRKNPITPETKISEFKGAIKNFSTLPDDIIKDMARQIPDESPYFHRILVGPRGRIYVLLTNMEKPGRQDLDIFSPGGEFLYHCELDLSADFKRISTIAFSFKRGECFVFAEDEEGEAHLAKYKIQLPQ